MPHTDYRSKVLTLFRLPALQNFCRDNSGSTAVEYALMVAALSGIMLASIQTLGKASSSTFEQLAQTMEAVAPASENAPQATTLEAPVAISISPVKP